MRITLQTNILGISQRPLANRVKQKKKKKVEISITTYWGSFDLSINFCKVHERIS
jgi:hypothetical protein